MKYVFESFTLDTEKRYLKRNKKNVDLTPKVYSLLLLLLESQGRVVSKSEIYDKLWPGRVVSEATLYKVVERLRTVLGDSANNPRFVKTIHSMGYVFTNEYWVSRRSSGFFKNLGYLWLKIAS